MQELLLSSKAQGHLARRWINGRDHKILTVLCALWVFFKVALHDKVHPEADVVVKRKSVAEAWRAVIRAGGQIDVDNFESCVVGQDVGIFRVVGEDTTSTTAGGVPCSITFDKICLVSLSYTARRWAAIVQVGHEAENTYGASQYVELSSIVSRSENGLGQLDEQGY